MATCRECLCYELCQENLLIEIADLYDIDFEDIDKYLDTSKWLIDKRKACKHFKNKSDYVKRERGEWKYNFDASYLVRCDCRIKCSKCGHTLSRMTGVNYKFCPNCGADMRKEDNNG